jgi:hypothetical protein
MRRRVLISIGILETLLACVLIVVGFRLPASERIDQGFERVGSVSRGAQREVQLMRHQIAEVRRKDFPKVASQLRTQSRAVTTNLKAQAIDFDSVEATSEALGAVAQGLESWSETLDAGKYLPTARGLGLTADIIDLQVVVSTALSPYLGGDFNPEQAVERFRCVAAGQELAAAFLGGGSICRDCNRERFEAARAALRDLDSALASAVRQVDLLSDALIPVVTPNGVLPPTIEMRPVWPEGRRVADGLRQSRSRIQAINRDVDRIIRTIAGTPGIDELPDQLGQVRFGGELAELARSSSSGLRNPAQLRDLSNGLRRTQRGIEESLRAWPELVETMHRSATVLNGSHRQLEVVLAQRAECERAVRNSQQLADTTEELLQGYSSKLDVRLGEQERTLGQMERSLGEVNEALPVVAQSATDLLSVVRWMFWLIGALLALHGIFVAAEAQLKR